MSKQLLFASSLLFSSLSASSQQLYFYMNDASVHIYTLEEVTRMDFEANQLQLHLNDQSVVNLALEDLNYYRYLPDGVTQITEADRPELRFFPNPADQELNLRFSLPETGNAAEIRLHNLKGEVVMVRELSASANGETKLDLSKLPAGQYFCTLRSGKTVISKAFMKR